MFIALLAGVLGLIWWDSKWAERETSAAFELRMHLVPHLTFDQQYFRGVICGTYKFPSQSPRRFVFVSHDSSGEIPEGLLVPSDPNYLAIASKSCR